MRIAVVALLLSATVQANERELRVLLSARLCAQQRQLAAAISNNRDLKRVHEDPEPLDDYKQKIAGAKQAITDAGFKPIACNDSTVKRVSRCVPEAGDGYQVGYPEDPACDRPAMQRFLKADVAP